MKNIFLKEIDFNKILTIKIDKKLTKMKSEMDKKIMK